MNNNNSNEPVVLGTLKKEKSSKPIFVFFVFVLLLGTCFGLPYIQDYMSSHDNTLTRLYNTYFGDDSTNTNISTNTNPNTTLTLIASDALFTYENVKITNIELKDKTITYAITGPKSTVNLDNKLLYLEIYTQKQVLLTRIRIMGVASDTTTTIKQNLYNLTVNKSAKYYGKIALLSTDDYVSKDFKGGTITCFDDSDTYVYTFENGALTLINHTYINKDKTDTNYINEFNSYNMRVNAINTFTNSTATVTENDNGFTFDATLDLANLKVSELKEYIDYNYYDLNTAPFIIDYEMKTKGFECS